MRYFGIWRDEDLNSLGKRRRRFISEDKIGMQDTKSVPVYRSRDTWIWTSGKS